MAPSRSRATAGSPARRPASGRPARGPQPVRKPAAKPAGDGPRFRSGIAVRSALVAATLAAGVALAYMPVTDYFDLRGELTELEGEGTELHQQLSDAEFQKHKAESEIELRARCYANYVWPGTESYAIPGSGTGCVSVR